MLAKEPGPTLCRDDYGTYVIPEGDETGSVSGNSGESNDQTTLERLRKQKDELVEEVGEESIDIEERHEDDCTLWSQIPSIEFVPVLWKFCCQLGQLGMGMLLGYRLRQVNVAPGRFASHGFTLFKWLAIAQIMEIKHGVLRSVDGAGILGGVGAHER